MVETLQNGMTTQLDNGLRVTQVAEGDKLTLTINLQSNADGILHWGLSRRPGGTWSRPPESCWPHGTTAANGDAVRTPFAVNGNGQKSVTIHLDSSAPWRGFAFVVHSPKENRWIKSGGKDFVVPLLRQRGVSPEDKLAAWAPEEDCVRQTVALDSGDRLATAVNETPDGVYVRMVSDAAAPLVLHWGLAWQFQQEWQLPPENYRPAGTSLADDKAAHTPFAEREGLRYLELQFPRPAEGSGPRGLRFVLLHAEVGWIKSDGKDLYLPLFKSAGDARLPSPKLGELAEQIVGVEKGASSWTLMHRFSLCHDLLETAQDDEDALAMLFAWLRYSAIRQLDWQRCYNTKPRELSHAQDRLTARLAGIWRSHQPTSRCRFWARQMLTTLGRGGEGRVRDEILHIMHRNHLKEMAGNFIEEWHQKLHNNTTPDDVVICQAYLAFLRSNGDVGTFYRTLEQGGVTRERLRGFERAIKCDPTFYGDRKDALIGEFENFLKILKSVHSGTDLDSAIAAARGRLDGGLNRQLDGLLGLRGRSAAVNVLADAVTSAREGLAGAMAAAKDDAALRDMLFLDLALEELLRGAIERQNVSHLGRDELAGLVQAALRNLHLAADSAELSVCAGQWGALLGRSRDGRDWALHARSVTDRAARWVQQFTSDVYQRLQPKAEVLGAAFGVENWTVPLFSEEVIRGGPAFTLALLLRPLDRILRSAAGLGGWQVISPAQASGRVRAVNRLLDVQTERFAESTVLIADQVSGDEEIPEGVTAVLTSDSPDLVSHVAVRARNAGVLFATCFDGDEYQRLKELAGKSQSLHVTPGGDVEYSDEKGDAVHFEERGGTLRSQVRREKSCVPFFGWAVDQAQFAPGIVGAKANNLNGLRGRLPDWIHLPKSIALPFGVLERVLADERNRARRDEYAALLAATDEDNPSAALARLRAILSEIAAPPELQATLQECWQRAGLPSIPWEQTWHAVRRVWASKWNDRAFLSRRARGVPHDSLQMAVLIQQVVPADYAFVIHTANPITGDRGEIFAEVVLGMGETLVGNYPGRALGFVCRKGDLKPEILSYPGKSVGLYGRGVIFRSDSNGEDLEGFAGAGLYDSYLAEEPEHRLLDYRNEKLVWDVKFRDELLRSIARVGVEVERLLGSAQDIEGAVAGGAVHVVQTRPQVGLRDDSLAA